MILYLHTSKIEKCMLIIAEINLLLYISSTESYKDTILDPCWKTYTLYTCNISNVFQNEEYIMYSDNTVLIYVVKDLHSFLRTVTPNKKKIEYWCRFNKLSLNLKKCDFMILTYINVNLTR